MQKCPLNAKTSKICLAYILLKSTKEKVLPDEELVSAKSVLFYLINTERFNGKTLLYNYPGPRLDSAGKLEARISVAHH